MDNNDSTVSEQVEKSPLSFVPLQIVDAIDKEAVSISITKKTVHQGHLQQLRSHL